MSPKRRAALVAAGAVAAGVVVAVAIVVAGGDDGGSKPKPFVPDKDKTIVARGLAYHPTELTLEVGDAVTFRNRDNVAHTFTADDGQWNSRTIQPGTLYAYTLPRAGTFTFHCEIHPRMKGTITVHPRS